MARSQAIAAYACNTEPDTDMNPILLMMDRDETEVIINGESVGIKSSHEYKEYKQQAFKNVLAAFERLSETNDIIVIEGAGSPVELNLNQNDIVNMGLAKAVSAPVLLVSDILRGGVFASLYGTLALLPDDEKKLVKGLVVNKYKGKKGYFDDGVSTLERICEVPVLGVIPCIEVGLEDEDSLTDGETKTQASILSKIDTPDYNNYLQAEFDRLASHFRSNLNMPKLYEILNGGV